MNQSAIFSVAILTSLLSFLDKLFIQTGRDTFTKNKLPIEASFNLIFSNNLNF